MSIAIKFFKHGKPVEVPEKGSYYVAAVPAGTNKAEAAKQLRKEYKGSYFVIRETKVEAGTDKAKS